MSESRTLDALKKRAHRSAQGTGEICNYIAGVPKEYKVPVSANRYVLQRCYEINVFNDGY